MRRTRLLRWSAVAACLLAVSAVAAQGSSSKRADRVLYATTDQNQLIKLNARKPSQIRDVRSITGLPAGVTLAGIDFRPATGDLYGVGSDSVVYRLNPKTGIAVAEGPAFTPASPRQRRRSCSRSPATTRSSVTHCPDDAGQGTVRLVAAADPAVYTRIAVTLEPADGNPRRQGPTALRGVESDT